MTEDQALRAANLYSEGMSFSKVGEELGISKSRVGDLIREGISSMADNDAGIAVHEQENSVENEYESSPAGVGDDRYFNGILNRSFLIQATPILRKVALNAKVFMQHEYVQKVMGYEGDVGDLLVEALDFYWKSLGFTIKISHDSVI